MLEVREMEALFSVARGVVLKIQAATAIADTSTDLLAIADIPGKHSIADTTAKIAALLNRYEQEKENAERRRGRVVGTLPES